MRSSSVNKHSPAYLRAQRARQAARAKRAAASGTGGFVGKAIDRLFHALEGRALFATVSLTDFGAFPNDNVDDAQALRNALTAAGSNGTVIIPAGTFNINSEVDPKGAGRTIQGQPNSVLQGGTNYIFHFRGDGLTLTGLTLRGKGIFMDTTTGAMVSDDEG